MLSRDDRRAGSVKTPGGRLGVVERLRSRSRRNERRRDRPLAFDRLELADLLEPLMERAREGAALWDEGRGFVASLTTFLGMSFVAVSCT